MVYNRSSWDTFENSQSFISIYSDLFLIWTVLFLVTYLVICDFFLKKKIIFIDINVFISILILFFSILLLFNAITVNTIYSQSLLINDFFSSWIKIIIILFSIILFILSIFYLKNEFVYKFEYFILILLSILGLFTLTSSYDLVSMYLAVELQSLCFYILTSFKQYTNFSTEAGVKYFILGAFSSGILLFGCSLIYGFTGLTDFYSLELLLQTKGLPKELSNGLILGILFISVGFLFKLAAAPFHVWSPDVYEGAPTSITAIFAILPKIAILALFFRFIIYFLNQNFYYLNQFLLICSITSLIIGTFGAIYQIKLKRLLAYSAISHVGFLLIGFSIFSLESFYSILFYIVVYMSLSLSIFFYLLNLRRWSTKLKLKTISEVIILINANPILASLFALILFSIAGIPPLIGFYSKLYIFIVGFKSNFYLIIIIAAIISVISSIYYIRLIKLMFFKEVLYKILLNKISNNISYFITFSLFLNFIFLLWPDIVLVHLHNLILTIFI